MQPRPTLLNSCASAATAGEARYRISASLGSPRAARVIALDGTAAAIVGRVAARRWDGARFFRVGGEPPPIPERGSDASTTNGSNGRHRSMPDLLLENLAGGPELLSAVLADADVIILVATGAGGAADAATVGAACTGRGIMTTGLIFGDRELLGPTVAALRPHARVLMVSKDEEDVAEILTALRA